MPTALSSDLQRPMSLRQPDGSPQSRDTKTLKIMSSEPSYPNIHPYQVRHGGASHDAANELRSLTEIQARLRHATDATTKRYAKKVRYVAELAKLSASTVQYGDHVGENLAQALAGTLARAAPRRKRPGE